MYEQPPQIGLVSPGEMGAAVAGQLVQAGLTVRWASEGRSDASAARATAHGLVDVERGEALAATSGVLLSICPPAAALDVARSLAGFRGVYVDANAIAPRTAEAVAEVVETSGAEYVDGAIIGSPPRPGGSAVLHLSGGCAAIVADLFGGTLVDARVIDGERTAASALKLAFAAWSKASAALLLAVDEAATAAGVRKQLAAEWDRLEPSLPARLAAAERSRAQKGWRWGPEMREVAAMFAELGIPTGFHEAAAEVFAPQATRLRRSE